MAEKSDSIKVALLVALKAALKDWRRAAKMVVSKAEYWVDGMVLKKEEKWGSSWVETKAYWKADGLAVVLAVSLVVARAVVMVASTVRMKVYYLVFLRVGR